ncbi:glycoside hydrolase family 65 protein [Janibacter sp. GXQ6167]|uniref:glycoside hydrolase family 65 protein n=1 Tax=Janibacter sp. GXQ6167 TaxID=3240791 RepID=UPI0035234ED3
MVSQLDPGDPIDPHRFPLRDWSIVETRYDDSDLGTSESVFAVGNGYLGMRANPEEGRDAHVHGTFVNGFHETWQIQHAEAAYGFAQTGQTIVNAPDTKLMKLYVDDEPLTLSTADILDYERELDFRAGLLRRKVLWRTPSGKRVEVISTRMVSFTDRHLAVMTMQVTVLDGDAPVVISSQILNRQDGRDEYYVPDDALGAGFDPRKASTFDHRVLIPDPDPFVRPHRMILGYRCANSRMTLAVGADHVMETDNPVEELQDVEPDLGKKIFRVRASAGVPITLTKAVAYHSSRGVPVRELYDRCRRTLDRFREAGIDETHAAQRAWLDAYWERTDVVIEGQPRIQQATRWCLYQLAQAAARADQLGIAAKGVTGSGYEGHAFWDTEVYVIPFLTYTNPTMARNALRYRINLLDAARRRARDLAHRGALFPWRTINGEEASAYYAAGTAQFHINADIAYAFMTYADITGDRELLYRDGADVIVETARMWADLGFWRINSGESFHIHGVTGPDEYTTVVNNNLFTNVMARFNLRSAVDLMREMQREAPERYDQLVARLHLEEGEVTEWEACAEHLHIPYDETFNIHPQDDHFLECEAWDVAATPADKFPLLLHYHPLVIYRYQVLKQADVVLALFLRGEEFTAEDKRANFEYYDPITTGDSTLSAVVQSIIAAEVGYSDLALEYFRLGLLVDLADLHRNTSDGLHIASTGGVWNCLVFGFIGMRQSHGRLRFDPRLPRGWDGLEAPLQIQGRHLRVRVTQDQITVSMLSGEPLEIEIRGTSYTVTESEPVQVALDGQGPRLEWTGTTSGVGEAREDGTLLTAGYPDPDRPWQAGGLEAARKHCAQLEPPAAAGLS